MLYYDDSDPRNRVLDAVDRCDFGTALDLIGEMGGIDAMMSDGETLLHYAIEKSAGVLLEALLAGDCRSSISSCDEVRRTPLIVAAERGDLRSVELLIDAGAEVDRACGEGGGGDTALKRAVEKGHVSVVRYLLAKGADPAVKGWGGASAIDCVWHASFACRRSDIVNKELRSIKEFQRAPGLPDA